MSEKICKCEWCTKWSPKVKRVKEALKESPEMVAEFDEIVTKWLNDSNDRDYYWAMLEGTWPGWEWIVEEKKKRGLA